MSQSGRRPVIAVHPAVAKRSWDGSVRRSRSRSGRRPRASKASNSAPATLAPWGWATIDLTAALIADLTAIDPDRDPAAAARRFHAYHRRRGATYMALAREDAPTLDEADTADYDDAAWRPSDEEGYAGVMLDVVEALETGRPLDTALNVPNEGAIHGLAASDVVEVSCRVDRDGVRVSSIGEIPASPLALIQAVKAYERLTVRAIQARSRDLAVEALMAHPLVVSYPRAVALVDEYLEAHKAYLDWRPR